MYFVLIAKGMVRLSKNSAFSFKVKTRGSQMSTCPRCEGEGTIDCPKCCGVGQKYLVPLLSLGAKDCSCCNGFGDINCPDCEGLGEV